MKRIGGKATPWHDGDELGGFWFAYHPESFVQIPDMGRLEGWP